MVARDGSSTTQIFKTRAEQNSRGFFHFWIQMHQLKIQYRPIEALIPYARNAKQHSDAQVAQIAASISEFGYADFRFCIENDCYVVDVDGHVYRVCKRQRSKTGRLICKYETTRLVGSIDLYGYRIYRMTMNGVKKHVKGHRIALNAFQGEQPDLCANHKNGIKTDNRIENLEWVTVAQNNTHAIRTGLLDPKKIDQSSHAKVFKTDYVSIYALHKYFGIRRAELARNHRVCRQTIDNVVGTVHRVLGEIYATAAA